MPACRDCKLFRNDENGARCDFPNFKRACVVTILEKHLPNIRGDVLEVGFGIWKGVRLKIKRKATWHGVDPRFEDGEEGNNRKGRASKIPYEDGSFDWVIAFSTMEHWHSVGDSLAAGFAEIHRVLKPGGKFLATAPFHFHGHDAFYLGDEKLVRWVKRTVRSVGWDVQFEEWRRDYDPLPPDYGWDPKRQRETTKQYFVDRAVGLIKLHGGLPSSWTLEILATKRGMT